MNPWSVVLGAITTGILSYRVVPWVIEYVDARVQKDLEELNGKILPRTPGGDVLGHLECVIFFASFAFVGQILAAAWLVFKTAATWKTWSASKDLSYIEIQAKYRSVTIGTAANIVAALMGAGIAHLP